MPLVASCWQPANRIAATIGLFRFVTGLGEGFHELGSTDTNVTLEDSDDAQIFVLEDTVPADRSDIECELRAGDGDSITLESNSSTFTLEINSRSWQGVFYAKDLDAGEYTARCHADGQALDVAVGPSASEMFTSVSGPFLTVALWVIAVPGLLGLAGLAVIVIALALRLRSRTYLYPPYGGQGPPQP